MNRIPALLKRAVSRYFISITPIFFIHFGMQKNYEIDVQGNSNALDSEGCTSKVRNGCPHLEKCPLKNVSQKEFFYN